MSVNLNANLDVTALLDRSDLDSSAYRTFENDQNRPLKQSPKQPPRPSPEAAAAAAAGEAETTAESYARTAEREAGDAPPVVLEAASELLRNVFEGGPRVQKEKSWAELRTSRCLTMIGATGGAGVTTILADLAAALSKKGERVVIADRGPSVLPFHFGGRGFRSAPASFLRQGPSNDGPIHVVTGPAHAPTDDWMLSGLSDYESDADRILVACRPETSMEARQWAIKAPAVVLVLTPDPSSLLRLPAVLDEYRSADAAKAGPASLLLNKFEPSNELHSEIRAALSQRFGERLLPFVIRRDDAFPRSLAAGGTASATAPNSHAAEDIRMLVDWLRNHAAEPEL